MWGWMILVGIGIVLAVVLGCRNANHNYTIGSGLFKESDENLQKGEHLDPADYQYYNHQDKLS